MKQKMKQNNVTRGRRPAFRKIFFLLIFAISGLTLHAQPLEDMEYVLRYGFIQGGKVKLTTSDTTYLSKPAIHHFLRARTSGIAEQIYKVDDIYESIVDPKTLLPLKAVRNVKERKYRYYNEVVFNQKKDSIVSQKSGKKMVPDNMVDILGLFFYMRQPNFIQKLKEKNTYEMPIIHDDDLLNLRVNYLGTEEINTEFGKKECYVIAPIMKKGKLLERDGGIRFYITKDSRLLPVYMEFDMKIGAVKCELTSYKIHGVAQSR